MAGQECIFCKIAEGTIPSCRVHEDSSILAFLDINPIADGHTLVIPKIHCDRFHACSHRVVSDLMFLTGKIAQAVVSAIGAEGYNILCNTGSAAGQLVDHVHLHIIPRKTGDGVLAKWQHHRYSTGQADQIAERIRAELESVK